MPVDARFMDERKQLSSAEYVAIVKELMDFGLEEVRLTGGEPLVKRNFREIADALGALDLKRLGITTNAILLHHYFDVLERNRIKSVNISLDSLDPKNFNKITHGGSLERVLTNIDMALAKGFQIKLNVVAMKNHNDSEIFDFIEYAASRQIEVRFLELMRIGFACGSQEDQFLSASDIIETIKSRYTLQSLQREASSTSFNYMVDGRANIGFIASETMPFCSGCSRWRLSSDGKLFPCLLKSKGLSVRESTEEQRLEIYGELLGMKPYLRPKEVTTRMNSIGG